MDELSVNQRIKFLIENELDTNVHRFSKLLGLSDGTVRNYVDSKTKPGADFLSLMVQKVPGLRAHWLLTGEGAALDAIHNSVDASPIQVKKGRQSQVIGTNHGTATQTNYTTADCEKERDALKMENEWLRLQLKIQEALITAKDESLNLLRASSRKLFVVRIDLPEATSEDYQKLDNLIQSEFDQLIANTSRFGYQTPPGVYMVKAEATASTASVHQHVASVVSTINRQANTLVVAAETT